MTAVVEIRNLSKRFPGTRALDEVDLDVAAGEVHALVGQNGCGKSTLIKILSGFHEPDPGSEILIDGDSVKPGDAAAAKDAGLRFVHQDLALIDEMSVVENLAFGRGFDTARGRGLISWRRECRGAREMLDSLGFEIDVRRPLRELAAAERTGVAIARALWEWEKGAKVLVLDEPTATLPAGEVESLFQAVRRVRDRGVGVLFVSHRLDEVFTIADRISVLRDGAKVGTFDVAELDEGRLIDLMVGDAVVRTANGGAARGAAVMSVSDLYGTVLEDVGFEAYAGQVLGFAGLTGSGRDELLPMLFGSAPRNGEVRVDGELIEANSPQAAIDGGIALVPADRLRQGGIFEMPVATNLTLADLDEVCSRGRLIRAGRERRETEEWIERLDIRPPDPELPLASLSGGNQQKVVIAKWLRMTPRVLLLDEPTQGVDVGAKAMIHALLRRAAAEGAAVVIASGDDEEICDVCDRVLVIRDGAIVAEIDEGSVSLDELGLLQIGGNGAKEAGS